MKEKLSLVFLCFLVSCKGQSMHEPEGTTWFNDKLGNCRNQLQFAPNGKLKVYNCGFDEFSNARFRIKGDTVFIDHNPSISEAPG
ncbi:MAG: hypothetical protein ACJAS3_001304 [Roseivirga sp.]|jgi:hypothetical protein